MPLSFEELQSHTLAFVKQARAHVSCGDSVKAEGLLVKASELLDEHAAAEPADGEAEQLDARAQLHSLVLNSLAGVYKGHGKLPKAARALNEALDVERTAAAGPSAKTALNLCVVYTAQRKFDKALDASGLARDALEAQGSEDPLAWAALYHNEATARLHQFVGLAVGDPNKILEQLQLATSYARESDTDAGRALLKSLENSKIRLMEGLVPGANRTANQPVPPPPERSKRARKRHPVASKAPVTKLPNIYRSKAPRPPARTARKPPRPSKTHPDVSIAPATARQRAATPVKSPESAVISTGQEAAPLRTVASGSPRAVDPESDHQVKSEQKTQEPARSPTPAASRTPTPPTSPETQASPTSPLSPASGYEGAESNRPGSSPRPPSEPVGPAAAASTPPSTANTSPRRTPSSPSGTPSVHGDGGRPEAVTPLAASESGRAPPSVDAETPAASDDAGYSDDDFDV